MGQIDRANRPTEKSDGDNRNRDSKRLQLILIGISHTVLHRVSESPLQLTLLHIHSITSTETAKEDYFFGDDCFEDIIYHELLF